MFRPIMITLIKQKIKKFFSPTSSKKTDTHIGSIQFILNADEKIKIFCELPSVKTKSLDDISKLAEAYAKFLLRITDISSIEEVTKQLKTTTKNESPEIVLLVDNILFFEQLIMQQNHKKIYQEIFSTEPLIKPSSVFQSIK